MRYVLVALMWLVAVACVSLIHRVSPTLSPIVTIPLVSACGVITVVYLGTLSGSSSSSGA